MIKKIKNKIKERKEAEKNNPSAYDHHILSWHAPEHLHYNRGIVWKIIAVLFVAAAIILGYVYDDWTFSVAVMAFALVYYLFHREKPQIVNVKISDIGIKVGHRRYPFSKIKAFWIHYEPPYTNSLMIRVSNDLAVDIEIQLYDQNPSEVRELLLEKIPELEGEKESVLNLFSKLFKL